MNTAILTLLKAHFDARLRRVGKGFSSPRRILLSLFVVLLAIVWIGQTLASMLLREPFNPNTFRSSVSLLLLAYFCWHVVRVAWQRPDEAIEWSPEEEALVVGGPFSRRSVLVYRFAVIFTATLPKAVLTTLVLWPDLSWSGPLGLILALIFLELFRLVMDLGTNCLSPKGYNAFRFAVISSVAVLAWLGYQHGLQRLELAASGTGDLTLSQQAVVVGQSLSHSPLVEFAETPFRLAADVITGRGTPWSLMMKLLSLCVSVSGLGWMILSLDRRFAHLAVQRDRQLWRSHRDSGMSPAATVLTKERSRLPRVGPFGPLLWRQCKRARRYAGSLLVSMGIPAILASVPLFAVPNAEVAFIAVVCALLFYTFVLLPEAIKFDFRLDTDHMCQLKCLPMTSARVVVGQLATPVLLACAFQFSFILFAGLFRGVSNSMILGAICITTPLTVVFVALDNLVFLLYPHRPTQEGFEAFLRTILKFTGKSLLLVLAGGMLVLWAPLAAAMAKRMNFALTTGTIFYSGLSVGVVLLAATTLRMVIAAYDRFDVSVDAAG